MTEGERIDRLERSRHDDNILLDADDDDWAWRRRIRANPATARIYRLTVGVVGLLIVVTGLALVPLPGPGWLIVFAGLAVWGSEFEWAQRLLNWVRAKVRAWDGWIRAQPVWLQGLAILGTAIVVLALMWGLLKVSGVPAFFPDAAENWLHGVAGL
ncbi:MAG: TIGR02611 family protein [Actinobacteria bacterium]|uniref:TIGR02611 family protein n=1 Tax=Nostocoides veronense TaxID=330836 RepID=A0ABP4XKT1_9MICO|nr:TIGR02611 family protein [Actinomycetota bacterium]